LNCRTFSCTLWQFRLGNRVRLTEHDQSRVAETRAGDGAAGIAERLPWQLTSSAASTNTSSPGMRSADHCGFPSYLLEAGKVG
jgi:hypothetical protein